MADRRDSLTSSYLDKRYFLLRLDDEQKKLLTEVEKYDPECWNVTSRYLCLNGEKHLSLGKLSELLGVSTAYITIAVGTVLYFLDSPFDASLQSVEKARVLGERIEKAHEEEKELEFKRQTLHSLGLKEENVPDGMPFEFVEQFALIFKGWRQERLGEYLITPRERLILIRRYGIENKNFRSLEDVGQELGITRERVRQIENQALKRLRTWEDTLPSS